MERILHCLTSFGYVMLNHQHIGPSINNQIFITLSVQIYFGATERCNSGRQYSSEIEALLYHQCFLKCPPNCASAIPASFNV